MIQIVAANQGRYGGEGGGARERLSGDGFAYII